MPTILRFRGFNIMIFTEDHEPAHVHVRGKSKELILVLNCPEGHVQVRARYAMTNVEEAMLIQFVEENKMILCEAWENFHGSSKKA